VLDLRNASHGPLYVAVSIADAFLEEGEIVSVKGGSPEKIDHCNDRPGDIINGKPLVVLFSGGTASGAEADISRFALQEFSVCSNASLLVIRRRTVPLVSASNQDLSPP
jgi:C-terminal processing protease CtpA/Prc